MTGNPGHDSPRRAPGAKTPTRDVQGRWVRRAGAGAGDEAAVQDFVFDDRIIEGMQPPPAEERPRRPEDTRNPSEFVFSAPATVEPTDTATAPAGSEDSGDGATPPRPWTAALPTLPTLPGAYRPFVLVGGALLLGVALFVIQRGSSGDKRAEVTAPQPPPTIVAPVVVPSVPKQAARRPAARAAAAPAPRKEKAAAGNGAGAPKRVAPAVAAAPAPPARPDPPPAAEAGPVPAVNAPPQAKPEEEGWFNLAEEYVQLGDENRAEALYRRILSEGTQKGRAALALGDLFARKNDFNRAQEFYRASKRLFQDKDQPTASP
jgi:hypothetical protein